MAVNRRMTKQRLLVLEALRANLEHPTAEEIYLQLKERHPEISLGTVYRNLHVLCEQGDAVQISGCSSSDRFDGTVGPHYHFLCKECGSLYDLFLPYADELDALTESEFGHRVEQHTLVFDGVCKKCLEKKTVKKSDPVKEYCPIYTG